MPYSELMIRPMREELTRIGVEEMRTPEQVDETLTKTDGTVMVVVNSICGCAAGKARPGIARPCSTVLSPTRWPPFSPAPILRPLIKREATLRDTRLLHLRSRC